MPLTQLCRESYFLAHLMVVSICSALRLVCQGHHCWYHWHLILSLLPLTISVLATTLLVVSCAPRLRGGSLNRTGQRHISCIVFCFNDRTTLFAAYNGCSTRLWTLPTSALTLTTPQCLLCSLPVWQVRYQRPLYVPL